MTLTCQTCKETMAGPEITWGAKRYCSLACALTEMVPAGLVPGLQVRHGVSNQTGKVVYHPDALISVDQAHGMMVPWKLRNLTFVKSNTNPALSDPNRPSNT